MRVRKRWWVVLLAALVAGGGLLVVAGVYVGVFLKGGNATR